MSLADQEQAQNRMIGFYSTDPARHTPLEDAQGLFISAMVAALGLYLLNQVGLLTSGTAGVAFLLHYAFDIPFGILFFVVNLPFYYLSFKRLGVGFSFKTFIAIAMVSAIAELERRFLVIQYLDPFWAALLGGILIGFGLLGLYRHRASLGGIGILAIYIQDRFKIPAGLVQLAFDLCVMAAAFFVVSPMTVLWSLLSAVVLNLLLTINHRSDRYIAVR
ncbi:YitT family protein [Rhizobium deserti]|uniref:YitT family protein n=1 Tax=Rhizobium deserti TaxID=2547961 RepID=A0A4R5UH33_9HYPH|nr:YitT family protein [Rhizobium deserti]TDK35243.1 YitT family protein [Rhizobium deserti]